MKNKLNIFIFLLTFIILGKSYDVMASNQCVFMFGNTDPKTAVVIPSGYGYGCLYYTSHAPETHDFEGKGVVTNCQKDISCYKGVGFLHYLTFNGNEINFKFYDVTDGYASGNGQYCFGYQDNITLKYYNDFWNTDFNINSDNGAGYASEGIHTFFNLNGNKSWKVQIDDRKAFSGCPNYIYIFDKNANDREANIYFTDTDSSRTLKNTSGVGDEYMEYRLLSNNESVGPNWCNDLSSFRDIYAEEEDCQKESCGKTPGYFAKEFAKISTYGESEYYKCKANYLLRKKTLSYGTCNYVQEGSDIETVLYNSAAGFPLIYYSDYNHYYSINKGGFFDSSYETLNEVKNCDISNMQHAPGSVENNDDIQMNEVEKTELVSCTYSFKSDRDGSCYSYGLNITYSATPSTKTGLAIDITGTIYNMNSDYFIERYENDTRNEFKKFNLKDSSTFNQFSDLIKYNDSIKKWECADNMYYYSDFDNGFTTNYIYDEYGMNFRISATDESYWFKNTPFTETCDEVVDDDENKKKYEGQFFFGTGMGCEQISDGLIEGLHFIVVLIKIIVPILLIAFGSFDFAKAVMSGDNDANTKAIKSFMKRCIAALLIFFLPYLINLFLELVSIVLETDLSLCGIAKIVFQFHL